MVRPDARMRTLGCTACFRRHDKRNMACPATTGIRVAKRRGVYALRSGTAMGWRLRRIDRRGQAWLERDRVAAAAAKTPAPRDDRTAPHPAQ